MKAKIHPFITEFWKLDGGSCFGVIPKTIWSKIVTPDESNLIEIVSRCLLIESNNRLIVVDTGIGNKFNDKFYSFFHRTKIKSAATCIEELGLSPQDITDVIFTHLHWDHIGGATYTDSDNNSKLTFPNATHWCSKSGLDWALNPSKRERKAFFTEDIQPLIDAKKLNFIAPGTFDSNIEISILNGHTFGLVIPTIDTNKGKVVFVSDFIPSKAHLPIPFIPSQDIQPLISVTEKEKFMNETVVENHTLLFQHDPNHECCKLMNTDKGILGTESFIWTND